MTDWRTCDTCGCLFIHGDEDYADCLCYPTEKPVELLRKLIVNTPAATHIFDPFAGSGSTMLAAHTAGLPSTAIERDPGYANVALHRLAHITGEQPTLLT